MFVSLQGHKYGRRKTTETSVFEFSYLCVNSSLEELIKIKVILILRQGMFGQQNLQKSVMFLTNIRSFPAAAKCRVTQKPGNSSVLYRKTKNPFEPKTFLCKDFKVFKYHMKVETQKKRQFLSLNFYLKGSALFDPSVVEKASLVSCDRQFSVLSQAIHFLKVRHFPGKIDNKLNRFLEFFLEAALPLQQTFKKVLRPIFIWRGTCREFVARLAASRP